MSGLGYSPRRTSDPGPRINEISRTTTQALASVDDYFYSHLEPMMRLVSYVSQVDITVDAVCQCLLLAPPHFRPDKHKTYASDLPIGLHNSAASRSAPPSRQIRSYRRE